MSFSYGDKANLYLKYLVPLVEGAKPEMDFDIDHLKGMKIKTLWITKNEFQNIDVIRPDGKKLVVKTLEEVLSQELEPDQEIPEDFM